MSFWKRKNYCEYCGSVKNNDGSCPNSKCIAYKSSTKTDASKEEPMTKNKKR